jgi:hypothetical protein
LAYKKIVHFEGKYSYKTFGKDKFEKKKLKGFFPWTWQIDIEVKNFFATCFDLYRFLQSVTYLNWAHKI